MGYNDDFDDLRDDVETRRALAELERDERLSSDHLPYSSDQVLDDTAATEHEDLRLAPSGAEDDNDQPQSGPFRDEFAERQQRIARAKQMFPGDELAQIAFERQEERAAEKAMVGESPSLSGNPPSAYRAMLGNTRQVIANYGGPLGALASIPIEVVKFIADYDWEACPISIMFAPQTPPQLVLTGSSLVRPYILLEYGTRDGRAQVEIDVGFGGQLTVPASVVYVSVGLDAGSQIDFWLSAEIAFFACTRGTVLTRTRYLDNISDSAGGAAPTTITRPMMSGSMLFEREDPNSAWKLDFKDGNNITRYSRVVQAGTYVTTPIPLANDIVAVDVTNNGSGTLSARAIFQLAI